MRGHFLTLGDQVLIGEIFFRAAGGKVQAQLGAAHHQGVAHIVSGIAHIHEVDALKITEPLSNGQHIRQNLGGMELVGQAVPHGNLGILGQLLYDGLTEATVLNTIVHTAEDAGGVGDGFLFAHLRAAGS